MTKTTEQALREQKEDAARTLARAQNGGGAAVATSASAEAAIDAYVNEHAGGGGATFFRWGKGNEYIKTADDTVIPLSTEFTAVFDKVQVGYIRFNGKGNPPTRKMGPLFGGFVMPPRDSLGDDDQRLWELGLDGKPKDPWQSQILLPLVGATDDALYVFQTTSSTGRNAVGRLLTLCRRMQKREPGFYPVIKLDVGGFPRKDPRVGWVKTPAFTPVGRTPMDGTQKIDTSISADLNDSVENL
jgi:hypothetical protein